MAAIGAADPSGSTAADRARAQLASGGGGSTKVTVSPFQIPIKFGGYSYSRPINQGQFDGDLSTHSRAKEEVYRDEVERFDLTDDGVNGAMGAWYSFSDEARAALSKKMWYLGLIKDPNDFDAAYNQWKTAVEHAGRFAMTGREIDPQDVLEMMGDAASGPGGTRQQAGPVTRRQIDLTDPETAKAWIQQAFSQSMGRAPEDAEVRALADALNQRERANPTIQTSTPTKFDDEGNPVDTSVVTTGGVNSQAFLQNQIAADPEATAHQAAGELYPALLQALGAGLS